jgi:hypothetical protein
MRPFRELGNQHLKHLEHLKRIGQNQGAGRHPLRENQIRDLTSRENLRCGRGRLELTLAMPLRAAPLASAAMTTSRLFSAFRYALARLSHRCSSTGLR